jgi:Fic family protein
MLKVPEKAPDWKSITRNNFQKMFHFFKSPEIQELIEKTDHHYYYWDKVRQQPLSEEYDKEVVWAFIRLRRQMNSNATPIIDIHGQRFTFWLTDELQRNLHIVDQSTGGNLALWDPGSDKNASTRYMVASLMEEAITSSQIEGAVATIKDAKKMLIEKRKPKNKSEQMIYNNYITMQSIKDLGKKELNISVLLDLHRSITKGTLERIEEEGRFRSTKENVNVVTTYGEVLFVPPKADEIVERLQAMIDFANDGKERPFIHPVVKAVMLHFWMAYIHPFTDGNGRMARTLFYWYMLKHGYWLFEYTSISKTILKRTTKYANAYLYSEHDQNDLTYFIHFHIDVIMDAVEELKKHIESEREKNHRIRDEIVEHPELNVRQTRIVQHLMSNPHDVLTIKTHQTLNKLAYQTARSDLLDLEAKKWLKSIKKGKTFYFVPTDNFWEKIENKTNS